MGEPIVLSLNKSLVTPGSKGKKQRQAKFSMVRLTNLIYSPSGRQ
jgi:hypothetical protein